MLGNRQMKKRDISDCGGMKIKIQTKSLMMIFLLEECNNTCPHCVRFDEPMSPGYKLTFEQLKECLSDCHELQSIEWVHFSGGEPTLWRERKLDIADLLIEISKVGFDPGFTTNGINFYDYSKCKSLFEKYLDNASKTLRLYITIDTFHDNFDVQKGRAKGLDNFLEFKSNLPSKERKRLSLIVLTVISKDPKSLLPDEMVEYYESLGVEFRFLPLISMGKGKRFAHLCPDLSSDKPEDLGAYYRYRPKEIKKKEEDPHNLVLIGNDYYLHLPEWHTVARLGHLPEKVMNAYLEENEDVRD